MIARIWRGATALPRGQDYVGYLERTGVREYAATAGNLGVFVLRRSVGERAAFTIVSLWDDLASIKGFAGVDVDQAKFYPEDDDYLTDRELTVEHHEVVSTASIAPGRKVFDHVKLLVSDPAASRHLYEAALAPLGLRVVAAWDDGSFGFGVEDDDAFWLAPGSPTRGAHVAIAAPDRDAVDAFHAAALAAGASDNGAPGLRPRYHPDYYAAFVIDLDGHNLEAVFHGRPVGG